jgi:hypothetical protein
MPRLHPSGLLIDVDAVLRGQGADPAVIRQRKPLLVKYAQDAIEEGGPLLRPEVAYTRLDVAARCSDRVELAGGGVLTGEQVARLLDKAEHVIAAVCTVGPEIEKRASEMILADIVAGLALEGVGAAAVEALANWACRTWEEEAAGAGMQTTTPLNPGMIGWPVEVGQPEIFAVLDEPDMPVTLSDQSMMVPRVSLSMVIGLGREVRAEGIVCDYCQVRETCRYRIKAEEPSA